jgi:hypothetical protein
MQVGVAVLLNSFVMSSDSAERAERSEALAARKVPYTLDPLLASLTYGYIDDADLSDRLGRLFQVLLFLISCFTGVWTEGHGAPNGP